MHDAEKLEGICGSDDQVVVGVEPRVEVESSEAAGAQQLNHDEFDVGSGRVVAGVEADDGSVAQGQHVRQGRAPVRNISVVEGGFKELVLKEQTLVWSQILIDNGQ